ncbi:MAG: YkgJ family cysteine cluster protein [Cetobacterium sp.]
MKTKYSQDEFIEYMAGDGSVNLSPDGNCNSCNECCSILSPVSPKELQVLKRLFTRKIEKNYYKHLIHYKGEGIPSICPFSCYETKKCLIYSLRPTVCKKYHCNPDYAKIPTAEDFKNMDRFRYIYDVIPSKDIVAVFENITRKVLEARANKR